MPQVSAAHPVRRVLLFSAMWFVVIWHSLAMIVSVMPDSALASMIRPIFAPYLTLFRLENGWGFFAPDVEAGIQLRYVVEDAAGNRQTFIPTDKLSRLQPTWIWMTDRFRTVLQAPDEFGDAFGLSLCRDHAESRPVSVRIVRVDQKKFWQEDWIRGKNPLDPEFIEEQTVRVVTCPRT